MNRRQKKKKNTKYMNTFGYSYRKIRLYDRKEHEKLIKYDHEMKVNR